MQRKERGRTKEKLETIEIDKRRSMLRVRRTSKLETIDTEGLIVISAGEGQQGALEAFVHYRQVPLIEERPRNPRKFCSAPTDRAQVARGELNEAKKGTEFACFAASCKSGFQGALTEVHFPNYGTVLEAIEGESPFTALHSDATPRLLQCLLPLPPVFLRPLPAHALLASPDTRFVDLSYLDDCSNCVPLHEAAHRQDLRLIDVFVRDRRGKAAGEGGGGRRKNENKNKDKSKDKRVGV
ncbi:hypothetical protein D9615_010637 [Tricholomella constricta]|uniref:Uncharacterized protein n=1 Tax=Tricholomella constricta TaxID=117010 RepID=A0A8H5GKC4_9AGAR|nr:hypothetical protein D9615_010637 [Tricholomella constricta]